MRDKALRSGRKFSERNCSTATTPDVMKNSEENRSYSSCFDIQQRNPKITEVHRVCASYPSTRWPRHWPERSTHGGRRSDLKTKSKSNVSIRSEVRTFDQSVNHEIDLIFVTRDPVKSFDGQTELFDELDAFLDEQRNARLFRLGATTQCQTKGRMVVVGILHG